MHSKALSGLIGFFTGSFFESLSSRASYSANKMLPPQMEVALKSYKWKKKKLREALILKNVKVGPRCRKVEVKRPKKRCTNLPRQVIVLF